MSSFRPSARQLSLLGLVLSLTACGDIGLQAYGDPSFGLPNASAPGEESPDASSGSGMGSNGGGSGSGDNGGGGTASSDEQGCTYNQLQVNLQQATQDNSNPSQPLFAYQARTSESPPFDAMQILSYQASPYFGPAQPGTYDLSGMNYADCGLCVLLLGDCFASNQCDQVFFVSEGTLDIDVLSGNGGPFRATLRDAVFEEVTLDPSTYTSTPVAGGERWCLDEVTINAPTELYN
ncbi:MAG: hypothetical protein P8R54_28845 [Myxococcota bacterium]|nr:hypothetical protein [Myxococcota bacterium]